MRLPRLSLLAALFVLGGIHAPPLRGMEPTAVTNAPDLAPLPLTADSTPDVPVVLRVSRTPSSDTGRAGRDPGIVTAERGDDIYVAVQNLEPWIKSIKEKGHNDKTDIIDLVLFLNGSPLPGLHPSSFVAYHEALGPPPVYADRPVHYLHFYLECTPDSKEAWHLLLRRPDFHPRSLEVSVGFERLPPIQSYVGGNGRQKFEMVTLPALSFWLGVAVIFTSLALFLVLARNTAIIRDTHAPLRPDGRWPYSLARAQLACWFFLVLTSFFFLWALTGEMDTLNTSVLALLGISAGTALGAAFVESASEPGRPEEVVEGLAADDLSKPKPEIRRKLAHFLAEAEKHLAEVDAARAGIDDENKAEKDKNGLAFKKAGDRVRILKQQINYFRQPAWKGVLADLLVEKGFVSFHRFQILIWTVVLGMMFIAGVYSETAMPEFNATLLGLLGISGGTYVGFKLPMMERETPEDEGTKAEGASQGGGKRKAG